ncbi:MAG: hypothetical protein ACW97V_11040 [Promethearchaeota archaeon]|jgi:hypothetical protein
MPIQIDFKILDEVLNEEGNKQIQNNFELLISYLSDYLGLQPVDKKTRVTLVPEVSLVSGKDSHILDQGTRRKYKDNILIIEINETNRNFIPFILLRETFYCFVPNEVKENEMIKIYINQIVENNLENLSGFGEWHNLTRNRLVDRDFLIMQSDKLKKFFKIEASKGNESPIQFFFSELHENALAIGNRNIFNYYDELFEKFTYKTSKTLYNEDLIKTLIILLKIFVSNKKYVNITDYQNLFKEFVRRGDSNIQLSQRKFYENLQWINNCTPIAPSYNIVYTLIGRTPIFCTLIFNPLLERNKIRRLLEVFPFTDSPRIIENSFATKVVLSIVLPTVYLKDLLLFFNDLQSSGYLLSKNIYLFKTVRNFINFNYFLDTSDFSRIIDPQLRSYKKEFESEHLIEFRQNLPTYPLSTFEFAMVNRIRYLSVTGLTFDKRVETLNAIKEDIENEYRKQLTYIEDFRDSFEKLRISKQLKDDFLNFLKQNSNQGLMFLRENLKYLLQISDLIEKILTSNPNITSVNSLNLHLQVNPISQILEENLITKKENVIKIYLTEILPKCFQSIDLYRHEIEKIQLYYKIIGACFNLKIYNVKAIISIIDNPKLITEINKTKEERFKKAFKLVKSYKITNQKIEATINELLNHNPPIIIPMLLNTILTSQFAKFYPEIYLRDTPSIKNKIERLKSYFPRVLLTRAVNLESEEELIHLLFYSVNIQEKKEFVDALFTMFKEDLISVHRNFWSGISRQSITEALDFYNFENKQYFYTKDFFDQFKIFTKKILGEVKLEPFQKKNSIIHHKMMWSSNLKIENFVNTVKKRLSYKKTTFDLGLIRSLLDFREKLSENIGNHTKFIDQKSATFFQTYIKSIKIIPAFRKFGLAQYYLYFSPHNWDEVDIKLLLINTFQRIQYPAQIDPNQPLFLKTLFPYRTPNKSYINWLIKSKKNLQEICFFYIKKFYDITHFDRNLGKIGWSFSASRFKIHLQNVFFNQNYHPKLQNIRMFDLDKPSASGVYDLESEEFKELDLIFNYKSIDLKSFIGTKNYPIINSINSLLRKELVYPYINLKNLGFQDKITLIIPNIEEELKKKILNIFNFFNICRIYEIEGDFYLHGFNDLHPFETGFMIEIWFPKCELDEFFDVFDLLFEYLEIKHYLILTDLVDGNTFLKKVHGNLKFFEQYHPLTNLKWNEKDKIWMNHKLFNEKFEPLYPDLLYGNKRDIKNNEKVSEDEKL